jgi:hypothetical protein
MTLQVNGFESRDELNDKLITFDPGHQLLPRTQSQLAPANMAPADFA